VLAEYHAKFRYIMVDEYQDTNVAQYLWLRLLAQGSNNICCVGDDDQSIYGWRGAEVDNILRFDKDFPGAKVIRLEQNYRSTAHILAAASGVIANNSSRLGKTLRTDADQGDLVKVRGVWDGEQEARLIADDISSWRRQNRRYDNCAVLVRASWQMRAFEERFIVTGTPYRVIGGPRFFERAEIRDAMAYLRLIRSEADDLAFERVVNQPKRGVGDTTIQRMHVAARELNTYLTRAVEMEIRGDKIKGPAKTGLRRFILDMERWRALYNGGGAAETEHPRLLEIILEESGYTDMLQADKSPQSQTRLDNLKELVRAMGAFDTLAAFLEHVELVMDNAEGKGAEDQVQILTLHSAKGLEWPMVFLPGWEEEVFPSRRSLDESGAKGLEEERRLAYVGITRARERCYISFVANRQIYGRWTSVLPSRFIDELPPKHVDAISETGYVSPGGQFHGSETPSRWDSSSPRQGGTTGSRGASEDSPTVFDNTSAGGFRGGYDSPGWRRAQAAANERGNTRPPDIEGRAFRADDSDGRPLARGRTPGDMMASSDPAASSGLKMGQRIFHQKFGYGRIVGIEGAKLTVDFEKAGVKKVVESFVQRV
jgi:DNA helicase-2/ATP-dependent DNA helicase PcrA